MNSTYSQYRRCRFWPKGLSPVPVRAIPLLLFGVGLLVMRQPKAILDGSAEEFWRVAVGTVPGGIGAERDGWYVYYVRTLHGILVYRVRAHEVIHTPPSDPHLVRRESAVHSSQSGQDGRAGPLLDQVARPCATRKAIEQLWHESRSRDLASPYGIYHRYRMELAWARAQYTWSNRLFEWALFSTCWLIICCRPGARPAETGLRVAVSAVVLYVPYLLGYCLTHSAWAIHGGILYHHVISAYHGLLPAVPTTDLDLLIVALLPKPLAELTQSPSEPCIVWDPSEPRPTLVGVPVKACGVVLLGVLLGVLTSLLASLTRKRVLDTGAGGFVPR